MSRLTGVMLSLMVAAFAGGCGKTNPAADYSQLKSIPADKNGYTDSTAFLAEAACKVNVAEAGSANLNFIQGQKNSFTLTTKAIPGITSCQVFIDDDSKKLGVTVAPGQGGTWILSWTPPANFVGAKASDSHIVKVWAYPTDAGEMAFNQGRKESQILTLVVNKTQAIPTIDRIDGFPTSFTEGQAPKEFTISGHASSAAGVLPVAKGSCIVDQGHNTEKNLVLDGSSYFQLRGGNNSTTSWVFDPSALNAANYRIQDHADINDIEICVRFAVVDGNVASDPIEKMVYYTFKNQAPIFTFQGDQRPGDSSPITVKAGQKNAIAITAAIPDHVGTADIQFDKTIFNFSKQKGSPTLDDCHYGDNNDVSVRVCTLNWDVPCNLKESSDLLLDAYNTQGVKSPNRIRRKVLIDHSQGCQAESAQGAQSKTATPETKAQAPATDAEKNSAAPAPVKFHRSVAQITPPELPKSPAIAPASQTAQPRFALAQQKQSGGAQTPTPPASPAATTSRGVSTKAVSKTPALQGQKPAAKKSKAKGKPKASTPVKESQPISDNTAVSGGAL